jgi:hypothetical protein
MYPFTVRRHCVFTSPSGIRPPLAPPDLCEVVDSGPQ